ncbi:hypothetical protein DICVIV_13608 [Dictyocaulus viviparus]|uniref:SCP domain-containing protein n=1 Tax=Dictyocaulus viviparus TaxID=29172 RepID=A0A0D8X7C8_DICVI|nr:hypothetical protein DICVIV_13608 [Dictyocaulus viviparus]
MSLMTYDCSLEDSAYDIAKLCETNSIPNFDYTLSSNVTLQPPFKVDYLFYMNHDQMDKLGCAYFECSSPGFPFLSFVCKYGGSDVKPGTLLYKAGSPCSDCPDDCVDNSLCDYSNK